MPKQWLCVKVRFSFTRFWRQLCIEFAVSCLLPLPNFVRKINLSLKSLGMKVGTGKMEDCHEDWYALINTVPDAAAKVGSKFTANQLEFF